MKEIFRKLITFIFYVLVTLSILMVVGHVVDQKECFEIGQNINYPVKYEFWSGCSINVEDNIWVPIDNYIYRDN